MRVFFTYTLQIWQRRCRPCVCLPDSVKTVMPQLVLTPECQSSESCVRMIRAL